jgi:hypothetical protein
MNNITLERLEQIEIERNETMGNTQFQEWIKQLNVSRLYSKREGIDKANQMMADWDSTKILKTVHTFNFTR